MNNANSGGCERSPTISLSLVGLYCFYNIEIVQKLTICKTQWAASTHVSSGCVL